LRELYHGDEIKIRTSYLPFFHGLEAAFLRLAQSADGYVAWLSEASKVVRKAARYATVTGLWREAASITEARLGSDHPDVVTCLNNLAGLLHDQGDFTEAQRLFARALAGC